MVALEHSRNANAVLLPSATMNSNVSEKDLSPTSAHSSSKPQARFTMMTPSASPPIQQPYRQQSRGPPPSKKRRMSSTPSLLSIGARNFSTASRSSSSVPSSFSSDSTLDPLNELDAARRASSNKVLSVWSQLAAKYARRLDEDDIVDLRKEKIIKDNGVLRSTNHMYEIGCFAEQHEQEERDKPPVPADDEPDEIDAFAETPDNLSHTDTDGEDIGLELMQQSKRLPPVRELDPDDAADLAEFLEAEELQKDGLRDLDTEAAESFDEEGDEYETFDDEKRLTLDTRTSVEFVHREDDNEAIAKGNNYKTTDYLAPLNDEYEAEDSTPSPISYHLISKPSGSPELDTPGIIYSNQEYEGEDSDEVEIISWPKPSEVPHTTGQSSPLMADGDSEDELGIWEQDDGVLYSSDVTAGIDTVVEQDSKEARSPTPTLELCTPQHRINSQTEITRFLTHTEQSTKAKKTPKSRLKGKLSQTPTQPPSPPVQLQTPPRSSSFGPGSSKKNVSVTYSRKRTHETPAKKALRRVETSSSENSNTELEPEQKKMTSSKLSRTTQRSSSKPKKKSGSVSEDTVDDGSPRSRSPTRKAIKKVLSEGFSPEVHTKSSKAKGKEREIYSTIPSSLRLQSPRKGILESTPVSTPKQNASVRKRKRFTSPMETDADESPTDHVVMVAPSPSKTSTRKASSRQRLGKDNSPRGTSNVQLIIPFSGLHLLQAAQKRAGRVFNTLGRGQVFPQLHPMIRHLLVLLVNPSILAYSLLPLPRIHHQFHFRRLFRNENYLSLSLTCKTLQPNTISPKPYKACHS